MAEGVEYRGLFPRAFCLSQSSQPCISILFQLSWLPLVEYGFCVHLDLTATSTRDEFEFTDPCERATSLFPFAAHAHRLRAALRRLG